MDEKIMTMDKNERNVLFEKTLRSKTVLSFGYLKYYKLQCFAYMKRLCCCCSLWKSRERNLLKLQNRNNNAKDKLSQEMDILNIVRDLRVSRFLNSLWLTPYQQQSVDYFKQYSLETKAIKPSEWKDYSKKKLI